ncbi:hypothetical protein [Streptomyces nondiastaticus]|uniref:Uncharacterized protein n=1 Tax=Streptomyces nondiastaticus TaxID=3154512 RepID=A0ABW6U8M1_9ACTN
MGSERATTIGDGQVPEQTPEPPLRVRLPDGQVVVCRLLARRQSAEGLWLYQVALPLRAHVRLGDRDTTEPVGTVFYVAADQARPLPDVSCAGVPIRRHLLVVARARAGRRPRATAAPAGTRAATPPTRADWPQVRGDGTGYWKTERLRRTGTRLLAGSGASTAVRDYSTGDASGSGIGPVCRAQRHVVTGIFSRFAARPFEWACGVLSCPWRGAAARAPAALGCAAHGAGSGVSGVSG